jgi:hypothetical protein
MLILRVIAAQPLHGYAIAQRIHQLSREQLSVEEGSLYPALQKLLVKGWVKGIRLTAVQLGFRSDNLLTVTLRLPRSRYRILRESIPSTTM